MLPMRAAPTGSNATVSDRSPRTERIAYRPLHGILLLDKPPGASSNHALQQVRRLFRAEKAGHTGSLDPLATGLLPVCFGEATKIAGVLLGESKAYTTLARLGATTDTDDADGAVLRTRPIPELDDAAIDAALKQGGEPLYAKARRGETVEVAEREIEVFHIASVERGPDWLRLEVECGSGTYVRSLVRDLGETLGCGAHVAELRRSWVEPFRTPRMFDMTELQALAEQGETVLDACLLPIEAGMTGLPGVRVDAEQAQRLGRGQLSWVQQDQIASIRNGGILGGQLPPTADATTVALYEATGRTLGLGALSADGTLRAQRLFIWATQSGTVT